MQRIVLMILLAALSACSSKSQKPQAEGADFNGASNKVTGVSIAYDGRAPYQYESMIKPEVLSECAEINATLSESIQKFSKKLSVPLALTSDDKKEEGSQRTLTVEIVNAFPGVFVFGNLGSVPAELGVEFKVFDGSEIILEKYRSCSTNLAGFMGLQPSACNKLEKCAVNQGKYIAKYIKRSLYSK